ncbi:MAG TPA: GNAT family N-acetyltransferase [Candidatus Dormibacteraeota bacterium]
MAQTTDVELLQRCHDFELELSLAAAERVEDSGDGTTAVLSPGTPLVWDANFLLVEDRGLAAAEIAARADEVLGGLGMKHRFVVTRQPALADELEPEFEQLGWDLDRTLVMALRREADRPRSVEVEQVAPEVAEPLRLALMEGHPWTTPEVAPQLLEFDRRMARVYRDRWFAARHDGEAASACRLYQHDGVGQVEDVETLPHARNLGLARAVVLAAAQISREDGDELTFIAADATDWPLQLYERLGFDAVGVTLGFRLKPEPAS